MVVIEGDIVLNETTTVTISRSQALKDESKINYIKSAQVWVENENGVKYSGRETMTNGITQYLVSTSGLDATINTSFVLNCKEVRSMSQNYYSTYCSSD